MVKPVTNLSRNGLSDWLIQRVTALLLGISVVCLLVYILYHPHMNYQQWHALMSCLFVQVAGTVVLLCICAHAWIGLWTVFTDYIKCSKIRVVLEVGLVLLLLAYFIWGASILWG